MMDVYAHEAQQELIEVVEEIQKKWDVSNRTMNYICADLAQGYGARAYTEFAMDVRERQDGFAADIRERQKQMFELAGIY